MKKRILSMLLALTMIVGMLPMGVLTATAATTVTEVDSWEELKTALAASGTANIKLTADVELKLKSTVIITEIVNPQITVSGTKTLDLNGHSIKVEDKQNVGEHWDDGDLATSGDSESKRTLFVIPEGVSLTINDSGNDGSIEYTGGFEAEVGDLADRAHYNDYSHRDLFELSGTLVVNGGKLVAGNTQKEWINGGYTNAHYIAGESWLPGEGLYSDYFVDGEWFDSKYARHMVWGTVATVNDGATLVVNGGELVGRGEGETLTFNEEATRKDDLTIKTYDRNSIIQYASGSSVIVNGGSFKALGGANVFEGSGDLAVRAGFFQTDKHDYVRCWDADERPKFNALIYTCETIISGSYGNLGIPDSAWKDEAARMQVFVNNAIYNGDAAGKVELNETGGQTSGESLQVTIVPWLSDNKLPVTLNGGPYSNYSVNDGQVIDWNASSNNLVATVDYDPYFADTTGLENAAPVYTWHLWGHYGTNGEVSKDIVTTTGRLDISAAWKEAAGTANFRQMKVSCVVSEAPTNCAYRMETKTYEFRLDPTKTPLDESSLPGGKMEVDISYPAFSGSNTDIVVTVKPSAEDLADSAYGSSTVRYEYLYRDNMAEWEDEPFAYYNNTYNFNDTDWGHVKFDVTMIVYGSDGIARRFTKSAWALKLPDITVSGATLNSDKTAYVGNPGSSVTLKAPIDTTNAQVAADKIVASDIEGWYRVAYDTNGKPAYSNAPGEWNGTSVTLKENGTYCYAAYDRDGNLVYSKPVKVEFSAEAYGIGIKKSNDYIFTVYNNGSIPQSLTITATYGSSVTEGNIRWAIQSYPQGMSTSDFTYVNAHGKSAISFQKLFKDVKTIVPGNYLVMAYVVKDGQYLTASNAVTVEVGRIADFVDITDEAGNVISGKTMEGPSAGNTMKLNCVPGNGASAPSVYTVAWKVESLVGTNVATIDANGVLTINKPGQIKVTATATVGVGQTALANNTQTVIINIPITEVKVTLGTPTVGGNPDAIASVPADAPYELIYNNNSWVSGVHPSTGKFEGNLIPELGVSIVPKDGYVFPARQSELAEGDKTWYTYADEIVVKVNGTSYNFRDLADVYTSGSTQFGKDDYGNFVEAQMIKFSWIWDRLKDPSHSYVDYVNITANSIFAGDLNNSATFNHTCTNNDKVLPYSTSVYKVSGDYLNDSDVNNDNAVKVNSGDAFNQGQIYRVSVYLSASTNTWFTEQTIARVNSENAIIKPMTGDSLAGTGSAIVYYYFIPKAEVQTINELYIGGLSTPVGYSKPATADDITEFLSNFAVGDEVYVTRLTWFYDVNNNGVIDTGEDSGDSFNADGSFIAGLRYSVYLELEARDRDDDGKGDYVKFADNAKIYLSSQSNAQMTGNQNGAVYKFPAATVPAKAVTTDPGQVTIELEEGYTGRPITTINVTSVGTTEITSITAEAEDSTLLQVNASGMSINVLPATTGLAKGTYRTSVVIKDNGGNVLTTVPVTIAVGEPAASNITVNCIGDIDYTVSGNVVTVDHEVACKVGYLDGTTYKAITATANGDGTYSFTAPAGVTEVLLVVKGDVNGDGSISLADSTRTKAAYNKKTTLTSEAKFAADANGDNDITLADSTRIKAAYNKKTTLSW